MRSRTNETNSSGGKSKSPKARIKTGSASATIHFLATTDGKKVTYVLAAVVRKQRKELGLTQSKVALLAGCQRQFVSEIERGKMSVRLDKTLDLLRVLGLQLTVEYGSGEIQTRTEFR